MLLQVNASNRFRVIPKVFLVSLRLERSGREIKAFFTQSRKVAKKDNSGNPEAEKSFCFRMYPSISMFQLLFIG
jgi:hypothetical protein